MMKMVPHNHHHRPLSPFDNDSCAGGGDGDGPTTSSASVSMYMTHHHHNINHVVSGGYASPAVSAAAVHSGGVAVRTLQPFDISTRPPFKSPVDGGFNLRLSSSSTDPEPGRCRRTDGKKWRCSRDVAPNHKYCERHMHRGRPRSRKPVEVQTDSSATDNNEQTKRARQDFHHPYPTPSVSVAVSNPVITNAGSSSQFLQSGTSQPLRESSLSLDKYGVKASNFGSFASVPSESQPRGLDWMLKGDPISIAASEPEWQPLMQAKADFIKQSSCSGSGSNNNAATLSSSSYEDALYLSSFASFNSGLDQQNRHCSLFLNPLLPMENPEPRKPRGFIDAWSNAETAENNNANASKSPVSSNAKLSLSSLDLSMAGGSAVDEEMRSIHMGLGLMEPGGNTENGNKTHLASWLTPAAAHWGGSTPGGPLAEVLRPSAGAPANEAASNPESPVMTNAESGSPLATMVSSPSGVLQRTLGSISDCSSNSSPTVASSRANSEFALLLFNKAN
ncbi:growth-regulating factor 1-like isoform X2 [Prosopis cineraria]|uniref:growth-regulating factor 1-like isoform X2 n=1 Tax=Prosopis cineraria TaxID=364024 RepID=UPI00240ECAD6|nr:growth-regulating factor 1-like isoform X2 [Prosopis cineraria]